MSISSGERSKNHNFIQDTVKSLNSDLRRRIELAKKLGAKLENSAGSGRLGSDANFPGENVDSSFSDNNHNDTGFTYEEMSSYYDVSDREEIADDAGEIKITDEDVGIYKRGRERGNGGRIIAFIIIVGFIFLLMYAK